MAPKERKRRRRRRSAAGSHLLYSLVGLLFPLGLKLLSLTWSIRILNRKVYREKVLTRSPLIGALWHQYILSGITAFQNLGVMLIISRSKDGELIQRVSQRLGYRSVRGSSSRGGHSALHWIIKGLQEGGQTAIMVDGPRGPARSIPKPGIIMMAKESGAPIVPLACVVRPSLQAPSWDRLTIPLPGSRIVHSFGDPVFVPSDLPVEEFPAFQERIRDAINEAEKKAEAFLDGSRP